MVAFAVLSRRTDASAGEEETVVWRSSPGRYTGELEPTLTRESAATNNTTCEPAATQHVNSCDAFVFKSYIRVMPGYNHIVPVSIILHFIVHYFLQLRGKYLHK